MRRMISKAHDTADGLKINGNLETTGYIEGGYQVDKDLTAEAIDGTPISFVFQHARLNNGKLSITFALKLKNPTIAYESKMVGMRGNAIQIPEEVGKKLFPMTDFSGNRTIANMVSIAQGFDANGNLLPINTNAMASIGIGKISDGQLTWNLHLTAPAAPENTYFWRFEFNFIV